MISSMVFEFLVTKCFLSSPAHLRATGVSSKATDGWHGLPFLIAVAIFLPLYLKNKVP